MWATVLLPVLPLLGRCGLEQVLALNPPKFVLTSQITDTFSIGIDGDNNEIEFRGVELYYRFYPESSVPNDNLATQSELKTAGFRRLADTGDTTTFIERPLVKIAPADRGDVITITLSIDEDTEPEGAVNNTQVDATRGSPAVSIDYPEPPPLTYPIEVRRGVADENQNFKAFDDFEVGDADIAHFATTAKIYDNVKMAVYALSYGKQDIATPAYSRAVYLQYIEIEKLEVQPKS